MDIAENKLIILGLKRAMTATFTADKWKELGYLTGTSDWINTHPRLLRSLDWGDSDYPEHVFRTVEMMVNADENNLRILNDYVKPKEWLEKHDPKLYQQIYSGRHVSLDEVIHTAEIMDVAELNRHADRISSSIEDDTELAIGSTKELLETVFKTILEHNGEKTDNIDLPALWKKVTNILDLNPASIGIGLHGVQGVRKLRSSLFGIVHSIAEMRNLYGTGHGKTRASVPDKEDARLVVNAGIALATYALNRWKSIKTKQGVAF